MEEDQRVFWVADVKHDTPYMGGLYYRSEIKDFVNKVEANGDKRIVGIVIDDTYNLEFIYEEIDNIISVDFGGEEE